MQKIELCEALKIYRSRVSILKKGYEQECFRIQQIARMPIGEMAVDEITSVHIAGYRDMRLASLNVRTKEPISPATVRLEMSLLSNFFDIARIEWGYCNSNPVKDVRKPKVPPGRERRLTPREERLIHRYCHKHKNNELYSIVVFAVETAMRQGEILNLRWENINLTARVATLPETKNGTKRDVPLTLVARDMLIRLGAKSSGKVFSYTSNGLKSTWRLMLQRLKIEDLHFHDLRHEAVSRLFEKGSLDMMEIAAISGHKSLSMLKRYTHLKAQRLVRKMEAPKNQSKAAILNNLIPYPAELSIKDEKIVVKVLDFENLEISGTVLSDVIATAQDRLLRLIISEMKHARTLPRPDQYLEVVAQERIIMIDPLSEMTEI